jgi:hypothetical protein
VTSRSSGVFQWWHNNYCGWSRYPYRLCKRNSRTMMSISFYSCGFSPIVALELVSLLHVWSLSTPRGISAGRQTSLTRHSWPFAGKWLGRYIEVSCDEFRPLHARRDCSFRVHGVVLLSPVNSGIDWWRNFLLERVGTLIMRIRIFLDYIYIYIGYWSSFNFHGGQ